jgi:hypothetical protein
VYDPSKRSWTEISAPALGATPSARSDPIFVSAGGKLYVMGGEGMQSYSIICQYIEHTARDHGSSFQGCAYKFMNHVKEK